MYIACQYILQYTLIIFNLLYVLLKWVKKHSNVQLIAFNISLNYNTFAC